MRVLGDAGFGRNDKIHALKLPRVPCHGDGKFYKQRKLFGIGKTKNTLTDKEVSGHLHEEVAKDRFSVSRNSSYCC